MLALLLALLPQLALLVAPPQPPPLLVAAACTGAAASAASSSSSRSSSSRSAAHVVWHAQDGKPILLTFQLAFRLEIIMSRLTFVFAATALLLAPGHAQEGAGGGRVRGGQASTMGAADPSLHYLHRAPSQVTNAKRCTRPQRPSPSCRRSSL